MKKRVIIVVFLTFRLQWYFYLYPQFVFSIYFRLSNKCRNAQSYSSTFLITLSNSILTRYFLGRRETNSALLYFGWIWEWNFACKKTQIEDRDLNFKLHAKLIQSVYLYILYFFVDSIRLFPLKLVHVRYLRIKCMKLLDKIFSYGSR